MIGRKMIEHHLMVVRFVAVIMSQLWFFTFPLGCQRHPQSLNLNHATQKEAETDNNAKANPVDLDELRNRIDEVVPTKELGLGNNT